MVGGLGRFLRQNAIALLALFVALGGTAYAAVSLPRNSVGAKQLKKNAVRTKKIKNGAVKTNKISNGAVATNKIKNHAVTAAKINTQGLTVPNATTVGGKKVRQFFANYAPSTSGTLISVDGVKLAGACDVNSNPGMSVQNDSGQPAMLGGYSSSSGVGDLVNTNLTATPMGLTASPGQNGGGVFTVQLQNGVVVSVQFAATGTIGGSLGGGCYYSGSVIAS